MLRAFKISCCDDDHGNVINFAESANEARRQGNGDRCDCGYINLAAVRAPAFDKYRDVPLTPVEYLAEGWHFDCQWCEKRLYADDKPIAGSWAVFCSAACEAKWAAKCPAYLGGTAEPATP
jgi:hypothetical protein